MYWHSNSGYLWVIGIQYFKKYSWLAAVAYACNPSTLGGLGGRITSGQEFGTSLANMVKSCLHQKCENLAGCNGGCPSSQLHRRLRRQNCLNPGGGGCSELKSCHCTPAWAPEQSKTPS